MVVLKHLVFSLLIYHNHIFCGKLRWRERGEERCPADRQHLYLAEDSFHCTF